MIAIRGLREKKEANANELLLLLLLDNKKHIE